MQPSFVHLRLHSEFSLVDGIVKIKPLVKRLIELNMPAVAITESSNLFSLVKFYKASLAAGVKAIVGSDVYIFNPEEPNNPHYLTLLVNNKIGYVSLTELISKAYQEGQHQGIPILKPEWLEQNSAGLIALSGAMQGEIGRALLAGKQALAVEKAQKWAAIFKDSFYLEIQRVGKLDEERYIHEVIDLAVNLDLPVVATNDVRFLHKKDFAAHEVRVCINQGRVLDDPRRPKNYTEQQYLRSSEEMQALFADIPEALANSVQIAKRCNLQLSLGENYLPDFPVPAGVTLEQHFRQASQQGLEERLQQHPPIGKGTFSENRVAYNQRLEIELNVICQMGFPGYFMIVADFIQWAKNHAIPVGPGRGSGAGSLVAYVLKITDLDPLEFDLLFERFLNPERVSMPDFDIDFCMDRRDEVIDYVAQRYGRDRVSQIITYGSMAAKAVIRDVGRVLNHGYGFVDRLAKLIPFEIGMTLEKALKDSSELRGLYESDEEVKNLISMALSLEGIVRNAGKHAGGVVISPTKLTDFTPLYCEEGGGNLVTQFDKNDVEAVGLVKFDFLGLRTLTVIDWALQAINKKNQVQGLASVDISQIPRDDTAAYDLLKNSQTTAVFQLESRGMKELIGRLKPDCFDDIIALVALYRPGPLESGMVDDYVKVKHGEKAAEYSHPLLIPILKPTNGVILYQEQVMQIAREMAGYTLGGADMLRRCLSGSTQVIDVATGQSVSLQEIADNTDYWLGRNLFSLDLATQKIVPKPITAIYSNGIRDVWEITTKTNRKIRATADHLFYTVLGWQPLAEFKLSDSIALTKCLPITYESQISNAQIKIAAYLIGDGYLTTKAEKRVGSYFCNSDEKLINDFNDCCLELFGRKVPLAYQHHEGKKSIFYARINFNEFNRWIDNHIKRGCAKDKEIPTWVYQLSAKQLALFIGILWSTDGSFDTNIGHTDYTSTSLVLIRQLQHLLLRLGIVALFNIKKIQYKNQPHISYRVQITGREDVLKFYNVITPFLSASKAEKAQLCYERIKVKLSNQSKHQLPIAVTCLIAEAKQVSGMTWAEIDSIMNMPSGSMSSGLNFKNPHRELSRHRVHYFSQAFNNERLKAIADSEIFWDKIVSIEYSGKEAVFDLTIPETHNFIANDFIAHNCMGKKDVKEMAQQRASFVSGSVANQIDEKIATYIFDLMEKFAGYGFNKSHSAAYALVAYQTAWLKAHYPAEFMAAVLSADMDNTDKIVILIEECRQMKLIVCPPNLNVSGYQFTVNSQNEIVYGLGAIKGAGQAGIDDLLTERRENGAFLGLYDLCKRVVTRKVNRRVLESLIKAGAFDSLDNNPAKLFAQLPEALRVAEQYSKSAAAGQNDFFGLIADTTTDKEPTFENITVEPWSFRERLEAEKLTLGLYLSGHPIDQYEQELKKFTSGKIAKLIEDADKSRGKIEIKIAGFIVDIKMQADKNRCFAMLDDKSERLDVAIFSEVYEQSRHLLSKNNLLVIEGTLEKNNYSGALRMTAKKLYSIEQARTNFANFLFFEWRCQDKQQSATAFIQTLREILTPFRGGGCSLVIRYISATAIANLMLGDEWRVHASDELLIKLQRFSEITGVEIKYK